MRPGRSRRARVAAAFEEFHDTLTTALGAMAGLSDAATRAHAEAMAEMWLRTDGIDAARADPALAAVLANPQLAGPVAAVAADREHAFDAWLRTGPAELSAVLAAAAPDSAGLDPDRWLGQPGKVDGSGPVPGLWRIGTGAVGATPAPFAKGAFGVGVPLLDESHLQLTSTPESREAAEALVELLVLRVLSYFRPGLVQVHVWDVGQLAGALPGLYPLSRTGLLTVHDPARLPQLLEELSDRIRRVHTRMLVDGHPSLRALSAATGTRSEPWVLAVLLGNRRGLGEEEHRQLQRVARGGPACGVQFVLLDVPISVNAPVERVQFRDDGSATTSMTGAYVTVAPDRAPGREATTAAAHAIADAHEVWRSRVGTFRDLLPERWGTASSRRGLHAPIGFADGIACEISLADSSPHALIGGPSGSGKTNLLLAMISSLATRYDPDELEFYLLDFKEGVSFAQFAPGRRDTTWLPHARLVGVNINTDREFGLALLHFLSDEMRRRAEAAKAHEVTKLEELRAADPDGRWPRIVAVIDEFQYLFAERDAVTKQAAMLLEDVARRGRSQGIHLVLASQDTSGIEAFWGRPAIFEQFVLRIALPRARRVLADLNEAALDLPRWHAVLNHESGIRHGNEVVRLPDATARGTTDEVQRALHDEYAEGRPRPVLFDGSRAPTLDALLAGLPPAGPEPRALLGQTIAVDGAAAVVRLPDAPGRNVAVLGARPDDALRMISAAAGSLAGQFPPGAVDVVLAPLVADAVPAAQALAARFTAAGHAPETVGLDGYRARVQALAAEVTARLSGGERRPVLLVVLAADAADALLEAPGTEALRRVLRSGPETGVHTLGWWRSAGRLRGAVSAPDDVGCWVALDVQGSELAGLNPTMLVQWAPRPGRGLLYDRAQHARPEVVIVPAGEPS
ncbi:MAG: FtsK/SpoIIIE domain-containing protein [Pseudonocardiales bacterium]|nr:FtsK/SpoIIIE domain-containing protein [Pseudonocardiales bacterium]